MIGKLITIRNANKVDMSNLPPDIYVIIEFDKSNRALYKGKSIKK